MRTGNLRRGIPALLPDELLTPLALGRNVRIERIVSRGHASAPGSWYDQNETELVFLLQGHARLEIEGQGELDLSPFDFIELPPHVRHRVTFTAPNADTIWLAVFYERAEDETSKALPRWSELPKGEG